MEKHRCCVLIMTSKLERVSPPLLAAWKEGRVEDFTALLKASRVADQLGLMDAPCAEESLAVFSAEWLRARCDMYRVLLDEVVAQGCESWDIQLTAAMCNRVAEMSIPSQGRSVMQKASALSYEAQHQQFKNMRGCRATLTAFLGCCGKQRRVLGGRMRDVGRLISRNMWNNQRLRRSDKWKRAVPDEPVPLLINGRAFKYRP